MNEDLILDAPEKKTKKERLVSLLSIIFLAGVLMGFLFKWMHWPYAGVLIFFSSILIIILNLFRFFSKKEKENNDYMRLAATAIWIAYVYFTFLQNMF